MIRAGLFIGVDQTGGLRRLNDAAAGAERMYRWALQQGMADKAHARLITDTGGKKVDPGEIYDAVKSIIDGAGVDQLIVYFAGHGVNLNRSEQWLLTEAQSNRARLSTCPGALSWRVTAAFGTSSSSRMHVE